MVPVPRLTVLTTSGVGISLQADVGSVTNIAHPSLEVHPVLTLLASQTIDLNDEACSYPNSWVLQLGLLAAYASDVERHWMENVMAAGCQYYEIQPTFFGCC